MQQYHIKDGKDIFATLMTLLSRKARKFAVILHAPTTIPILDKLKPFALADAGAKVNHSESALFFAFTPKTVELLSPTMSWLLRNKGAKSINLLNDVIFFRDDHSPLLEIFDGPLGTRILHLTPEEYGWCTEEGLILKIR